MSAVISAPLRTEALRRPLWKFAILTALILAIYVTRFEGGPLDILFTLAAPATLGECYSSCRDAHYSASWRPRFALR